MWMGNLSSHDPQHLGNVRTMIHWPKKLQAQSRSGTSERLHVGKLEGWGYPMLFGNLMIPLQHTSAGHGALGSSAWSVGFQSCFAVIFLCHVTILPFGMGMFIVSHYMLEVCDLFLDNTGLAVEGLPESQKRLHAILLLETVEVLETSEKGMSAFFIVRWPWPHGDKESKVMT